MRTIAMVLAVLVGAPAVAQDNYPDITGTWTGTGDSVMRSGDGPVTFAEDAITQVVTEQRGRRFAGEMHSTAGGETFKSRFVGVFVDETRFLWSEPGGFLEGRLVDADTIHSCYAGTAEDPIIAACNVLTRQAD